MTSLNKKLSLDERARAIHEYVIQESSVRIRELTPQDAHDALTKALATPGDLKMFRIIAESTAVLHKALIDNEPLANPAPLLEAYAGISSAVFALIVAAIRDDIRDEAINDLDRFPLPNDVH
jgi:hypothetical protein